VTFNEKKLCIIAHGATYDKLHSVISVAAAAVSMGSEVHILLTYGALDAFVKDLDVAPDTGKKEIDKAYAKAISQGKLPKLSELWKQVKDSGLVKVYTCSTSSQVLGLTREEIGKTDGVLGHTTFLKIAGDCKLIAI